VPRAANASGGGQPGTIVKCKAGRQTECLSVFHCAGSGVERDLPVIGREQWITDADYATPEARLPRLKEIFAASRSGPSPRPNSSDGMLNEHDIPAARSSRWRNWPTSLAAQDGHGGRGRSSEARQVPDGRQSDQAERESDGRHALAAAREHTDEVLAELGYKTDEIGALREKKVI